MELVGRPAATLGFMYEVGSIRAVDIAGVEKFVGHGASVVGRTSAMAIDDELRAGEYVSVGNSYDRSLPCARRDRDFAE
jgi:hypothetical protein